MAPAPDLLKRDFSASRPDERWVADITEFMTGEGTLFLAGVKDLYGRGLVGWSMGTRQTLGWRTPAEVLNDLLSSA